MSNNERIVFDVLRMTVSQDPNAMNQACQKLTQLEKQPGFGMYMMQIVGRSNTPVDVRKQGSTILKNFIRKQWQPNVTESPIPLDHKQMMKGNIVNLLLECPIGHVQNQICETIKLIAVHEFPELWKELLPTLLKNFQNPSLPKLFGIVMCVHSIFERYRGVVLDHGLANELNQIIDITGPPLRGLFGKMMQGFTNQVNTNIAPTYLKVTLMLLEIYYDLNHVDIQEFFQDKKTLSFFMKGFEFILSHAPTNQAPHTLFDKLRTQVCQIIQLYMEKYDQDFAPFAQTFVQSVCRLLGNLNKQKKMLEEEYNPLITAALKYLTIVSTGIRRDIFLKNPKVLEDMVKQIVIPNIYLRERDVDQFMHEPTDYIKMDIEGSDSYTRRKAAVDLLNGLKEYNHSVVTGIVLNQVKQLLHQYASSGKFMCKDAAIYLMISISIKSKTRRNGVIELNPNVQIGQFFAGHIVPELQKDQKNTHPIVISDCLKFLTLFRLHIATPDNFRQLLVPALLKWLRVKHVVIATYSAWAIERILSIYHSETGKMRFTANEVGPFSKQLFQNLFFCVEWTSQLQTGVGTLEYVIRAVLRVVEMLKQGIGPSVGKLLTSLKGLLEQVCRNPSNPKYNHFLFECIHSVIFYSPPNTYKNIEDALCPLLLEILQKQIKEFTPYVFQLLTQLLQLKASEQSSRWYVNQFKQWMKPFYWENTGNIPAIVGLIGAYCKVYPNVVLESENLVMLLTKFQNLIRNRRLDQEGFYILNHLIFNIKIERLRQYLPKIFTILLNRLQRMKTEKFLRCFIIYLSVIALRYSTGVIVQGVESVQNGLFERVLRTWLDNVHLVQGHYERKLCSTGLAKLFFELVSRPNIQPQVLKNCLFNCIKFLEVDEKKVTFMTEKEMEEFQEQINLSKAEYTGKFVKLKHMKQPAMDFSQGIKDSKVFLALRINELLNSTNQTIRMRVISVIKENDRRVYTNLGNYFRKARLNFNL